MEKHAKPIPLIIPIRDWHKHGSWQETLKVELSELPPNTRTVCLASVSNVFFRKYPFVFGVHMHDRSGQWQELKAFPGYEYCWETTDGRGLDQLNIHGPYNEAILKKIIRGFVKAGLELHNRWDLLITFGK